MHTHKKVLFICKKRNISYGNSFGLYNSARFVSAALNKLHIQSKVVQVNDNNDIDREVSLYKPTHVIIEALWVVPSKFLVLFKLHPKVHWYVRIHSETPFLASEGTATEWLKEYAKLPQRHFSLAANNFGMIHDIQKTFLVKCLYQPNIYDEIIYKKYECCCDDNIVNIGCFGAIRPLKNQLAQAFAAIEFAEQIDKKLRFHINSGRVEGKGEEVLKNLRSLFPIRNHQLVEHPWLSHDKFLKLVSEMDVGMQVSLTESFNIVTADFISRGVPIVVSSDINWMPYITKANPCDPKSIFRGLKRVWCLRDILKYLNIIALKLHNRKARRAWVKLLKCN